MSLQKMFWRMRFVIDAGNSARAQVKSTCCQLLGLSRLSWITGVTGIPSSTFNQT